MASRTVLVLGREDRSLLAVVRSLGRYGVRVHLGWCPEESLARASRYVAAVHDIPAYGPDGAWLERLRSLAATHRFDLTIPCDDRSIIPLHLHRAEIAALGTVALPNEEAFRVFFDKAETGRVARSLGINVPRERAVTTADEAGPVAADFAFPIILKPLRSYNLDRTSGKNYVRRVYDRAAFDRTLTSMLRSGPVLIQENFQGVGVGVEVLAHAGDVRFAFQHVRVHEKFGGGGSSYRRSAPLDPRLLAAAAALMRATTYTGLAMVEFKVAPGGGWILVEVNARVWGSLPLCLSAAADFPAYLYQLLVEGRRDFPKSYREHVYSRNLSRDVIWLGKNLTADRTDPNSGSLPLAAVLGEAMNVLRLREHSDTFAVDDPRPALRELAELTGGLAARAQASLRRAALRLPPVRRSQRARAEAALRRARTVLFVCKGNICRSPFAHQVASRAFPDSVRVLSAGHYPITGRPCPDEAQIAAREFGVELAAHRSNGLDRQVIEAADVIFVFDEEDRRQVLARDATAEPKVHRLGVLAPGPAVIADPYGGPVERFRVTYSTIARNVRAAAERCFGPVRNAS